MPKTLISLILIIISFSAGIIFLWPNYQKLNDLQIMIENKDQEIENRDDYYKKLFSLYGELNEHKEELAKIDLALTSNPPLPSLFKFFQKITPEHGLILTKIDSFVVEHLPERTGIDQITGHIGVSGRYSSFKNLLKSLEKSARVTEVETISFLTKRD